MKMAARIEAMGNQPRYAGTTRKVNGNAGLDRQAGAGAGQHPAGAAEAEESRRRISSTRWAICSTRTAPTNGSTRCSPSWRCAPQHTFQVLTKRAARMRDYFAGWAPWVARLAPPQRLARRLNRTPAGSRRADSAAACRRRRRSGSFQRRAAANSIDSCVCDPPYHLQSIVKRFAKTGRTDKTRTSSGPHQRTSNGFMNKVWDGGDVAFQTSTWEKVYRVLKPGAYIVAFSSSRTFGRMSVAIEDAGFITHPLIGWIFGQGFPKAHRVKVDGMEGWRYGGQALKPALEPIYVGQKPFSEINGTKNIERWGTGALNIDACRGSAARFFYTAKADADDRLGSKHPTVKPVDLMQWLCRLVTPKGGTVLDPFAGTGTTGEAAFREGFNAVLIERETEYQADIRRRMGLVLSGPDERSRESIKARLGDAPADHGPLFGGDAEAAE
jgi:DNA modification methylase